MTKYFTFVKNNSVTQYGLLPIRDVSGKTYHCQGVIDKLNALHEENTKLKEALKELKEIGDYQKMRMQELDDENEQLKAQLYCDSDEGVCTICKHHYLEKGKTYEKYYISKCKKGHEKCSKMDLKYCEDFEKELEE